MALKEFYADNMPPPSFDDLVHELVQDEMSFKLLVRRLFFDGKKYKLAQREVMKYSQDRPVDRGICLVEQAQRDPVLARDLIQTCASLGMRTKLLRFPPPREAEEAKPFLQPGKTIDDAHKAITGRELSLINDMNVSPLVSRAVMRADDDDRAWILLKYAQDDGCVAAELCLRYWQLVMTTDAPSGVFVLPPQQNPP